MDNKNPRISQRIIRIWADEIGTGDLVLAELDLRLVLLLNAIRQSPIHERLCFKGGTALNKLYFADGARLSIDLDFNAIGSEDIVFGNARALREGLVAIAENEGLHLRRHKRDGMGDHFLFGYSSVVDQVDHNIKVEVSILERFSILGYEQRQLSVPWQLIQLDSPFSLQTAPLTELIATKIRALHQRRKGRDLFDLYRAIPLINNTAVLRKLILYYFACVRVPFNLQLFLQAFEQKLFEPQFRDDLPPFLRQGLEFSWDTACQDVHNWLVDILVLDERDSQFLLLVKNLLGIATGQEASKVRRTTELPLVSLFAEHEDILSTEARTLRTDRLGIFLDQNRRT